LGAAPPARPPAPKTAPHTTPGSATAAQRETVANRAPGAATDKQLDAEKTGKSDPAARKTPIRPQDSGEIDLGDLGQLLEASGASGRRSGRRSGIRRNQLPAKWKWVLVAIGGVAIIVMVVVLSILYGGSSTPGGRRERDTSTSMVSQPHKILRDDVRCNGVAPNDLRRLLKSGACRL
jgi:hypothetical protein